MKKFTCIVLLSFIILGANLSQCYAAEIFEGVWRAVSEDVEKLEGVALGAGLLYSTSPYKGIDDQLWGVPVIIGKYKRLYLDGNSAGIILNNSDELILSLVGQPRFWGYDAGDSIAFAGMQDREWTFEGGLKASWNNDLFLLSVTGLTDLFNEHNGHEVKMVVSKEFFDGGITPRVGAKWLSDNLIEYYYGVAGTEVASGRPAYGGDSTVDFIAGFSAGYPLGNNWALYGDFEYEKYGSEIEDSPIVDEENSFTYMAGAVYRF